MQARRLAALAATLTLATFPAHAGVPIPWTPANTGVLWFDAKTGTWPSIPPSQPPGDATGAWWLTRRVAIHPHVPSISHLGSFFHGLYTSVGGGAWVTTTPACWLPLDPPPAFPPDSEEAWKFARRTAILGTGLTGCGIEGIAYDPLVANRMYVTAYDVVDLAGTEPVIGDAGVHVSDDGGWSWRRLAGGFRGNGLAVARTGLSTTIVTGFIQESNTKVGATPGNGSLLISRDDGQRWTAVTLPASGCADTPGTSQRITPTIVIDPRNPATIYAGTNAGLYVSADTGSTWRLARGVCGGVWGIALTNDSRTVYVGDANGVVARAPTATLVFETVRDLGAGKIQSLVLDPRDEQSLYAAMWSGADANVFRVPVSGGAPARLDDSLLREIVPLDRSWPAGLPKPFPLGFRDTNGAPAPSLFLTMRAPLPNPAPAPLWVSTIFRGVFVRGD